MLRAKRHWANKLSKDGSKREPSWNSRQKRHISIHSTKKLRRGHKHVWVIMIWSVECWYTEHSRWRLAGIYSPDGGEFRLANKGLVRKALSADFKLHQPWGQAGDPVPEIQKAQNVR